MEKSLYLVIFELDRNKNNYKDDSTKQIYKNFQELHVFLKDEKQKEYSIIGIFKHFKSDELSKLFRSLKKERDSI